MGLTISKTIDMLTGGMFKEKPTRVLMLGLDAAGKTTILYKLQLNELVTSIPTIGFNVEQLKYKGLDMTIWDVGGQDKIRALWRFYFENTDALIYVVDSADPDNIAVSKTELHDLLAKPALERIPILVLGNKNDLPEALSVDELIEKLNLKSLVNREVCCYSISAKNSVNIDITIDWLTKHSRTASS